MKIVAISDLHGLFPEMPKDPWDILCICGDIVPVRAQSNIPQCISWIKKEFIPWCESLPCEDVLLVAGNHDFVFEKTMHHELIQLFAGTKIHYLENDPVEIMGKKFYGTPYCHQFGNWAFMRSDDNLESIFENIPEKVDILLTHDAPWGTSDICMENVEWNKHEHIGSVPLRDAILEKKPRVVLHGHLHSTDHNVELMQDIEVYNVSVVNEKYQLAFPPLILEI